MTNFEDIQDLVIDWGYGKSLMIWHYSGKQFLKVVEEMLEFKTELDTWTRYRDYYEENPHKKIPEKEYARITKKLMLEMGDVFVTLIILCEQLDIDPVTCLDMTYDKIKDRKGKTINGQFVKEEDL